MTVTLLPSGPTTHRRPRRATRAAAALGVVVAVLAGSIAGTSAMAAVPAAGAVEVTLAPMGQGILREGEPLTVSVTVRNGSSLALGPADAALSLGTGSLRSRAEVRAWLDGDGAPGTLAGVASAAAEPVGVLSSTTFRITVPADDPALQNRDPGAYALRVSYEGPSGPIFSPAVVTVPDPAAESSGVGVVVPVTAPPAADGLLTAAQLSELTGPEGALAAQLDAVTGTSAILAVDPAVPAAIRVLGASAPPAVTEWLARLLALPNSRFALQFGDADVAAQLQSGLGSPLEPPPLQSYMSAGDFVPERGLEPTPGPAGVPTPAPTPTATGSPTDPVYPDLPDLLDVGTAVADVYWPLPGTADDGVVDALGATGTALTIVPSSPPGPPDAPAPASETTPARGETASGAGVLVYDADISAALSEASAIAETTLRGAPLAEATALLSFATREVGGAALLVALDRTAKSSRIGVSAALAAVADAPAAHPVNLPALARAPAESFTVLGFPRGDRIAAVNDLTDGAGRLADFATILDDPELITAPERASVLQLLATGWAGESAMWNAALAAHREQTAATLESVSLLPPTTVLLVSPGSDLPFSVRNALPFPVNVVLHAEPDNLFLQVQPQTVVEGAAPAANTNVPVPVEARVGNGDVVVELQLRSRTLVEIGGPQFAQVTVRAEWEAVGIVVLGVLVAGFLTLGVVRTVRSRRLAKEQGNAG